MQNLMPEFGRSLGLLPLLKPTNYGLQYAIGNEDAHISGNLRCFAFIQLILNISFDTLTC
jgi:hypothetical protein